MIYKTKSYRAFTALNTAFMLLLVVVMAYPYINVLAKAFNDSTDTMYGGITLFPRVPTLTNFKALLSDMQLVNSAFISVYRVLIGTALSLVVRFLAGYALAQRNLVGRKTILIFFMVPMYFSGGLIPTYMLYKTIGLINNFWVYVLPGMFAFFDMIVIRTYMNTLPDSLYESAKLDGANHFQIFTRLTVPLSTPILATVTLWTAVTHWNDWTTTLYYITKPGVFTLQYVLMQVVQQADRIKAMIRAAIEQGLDLSGQDIATTPEALRAAQVIFTTLPIILLYPFLQKYFIKGIMIGAIKE
jgi:putative aldouronate transport system permease protein